MAYEEEVAAVEEELQQMEAEGGGLIEMFSYRYGAILAFLLRN